MDYSIRKRVAADDLTAEEADALEWDRAEEKSDELRDRELEEEN